MSTRIRIVLAGTTALVLLVMTCWFWLLHSQSGARFLWGRVQQVVPGDLNAVSVSGSIAEGLMFDAIEFSNGSIGLSIDKVRFTADIDLLPVQVQVAPLEIRSLELRLPDSDQTAEEEPVDIPVIIESLQLPIPIFVSDAHLTDIEISRADESLQSISAIRFGGGLSDELMIDELQLESATGDLVGSASVDLKYPHELRLSLRGRTSDIGWDDLAEVDFQFEANGNAEILELALDSESQPLSVVGKISDALVIPEFDVVVDAPRITWPLRSAAPMWIAEELQVAIQGVVNRYELSAVSTMTTSPIGSVEIEIQGVGSTGGLSIQSAVVDGDSITGSGSGDLGWTGQPFVDFSTSIDRLAMSGLIDSWPGTHLAFGTVSGRWQGADVKLSTLEIGVTGSTFRGSGSGEIDASNGTVTGELRWQDFRWPLESTDPTFTSQSGDVTIDGILSDWVVDGRITMGFRDFPEGDLILLGNGDLDGVEVDIKESIVFGGGVVGAVNYSWRDARGFGGALELDEISTGVLASDWPGTVSGQIEFSGTQQPFLIDMELGSLTGQLHGAELSSQGRLLVTPGKIKATAFELSHGDASLDLDGELSARGGLAFRMDLPDLGSYVADAKGNIRGSGTVSLHSEQPSLDIELMAEQVAIGSINISTLTVGPGSDSSGDMPIGQQLAVNGISIDGTDYGNVFVSAAGSVADHELQVELTDGDLDTAFHLSGSIDDWRDIGRLSWSGQIQDAQLTYLEGEILGLQSPADLFVSGNRVSLNRTCLLVDADPAICAEVDWRRSESMNASAEFLSFPISLVNRFIDSELVFSQTVTGQLQAQSGDDIPSTINLDLDVSSGDIVNEFDDELVLHTGAGKFAFSTTNDTLGAGTFDMPIPGNGFIDIDFGVNNVANRRSSAVTGTIVVTLGDVSEMAKLFPFLDSDGGKLTADLSVRGVLDRPVFDGSFSLHDANLSYAPLGTHLKNIQIDATVAGSNKLDLRASFDAGQGSGTISTSAEYLAGESANIELDLSGRNLLLVDVPELRVVVDPDLEVGLNNRAIRLGGSIAIPDALLKPRSVPQAQVVESSDVVVVAGELTDADPGEESSGPFAINGEIQVSLGDNVRVDLGVATATLGRAVNFTWQDELMPIANGVISLNGSVSALGQVLTISNGAIRFPQVPASNPYLNISAEREIFGNTQVKSAGLLVTGSARNPVVEAYTYPRTTEERALTLLATGSDFDYEQGVGALDFGTYIAPKLFLSYGIGLFERDNVFSARYDLKRGFGIKASSGQKDSGLDLIYRIDR